jgi:diazepam-binding inhibitor (GABA receptor modulating acyl-CoA-binding protein)
MDPFLEAVANAPKLNGSPSNDEKGMLYGLYKQATVGDVNTAQPYFYEVVARGKWDAWNSHKSKTSDQAKQEYISFVSSLITKYGLKTA